MKRPIPRLLSVWACLLALAAPICAQTSTTASLKGRIIDDAADGIPGVVVTLTNPRTAIAEQNVVTDLEGGFVFKLLPPGDGYTLRASIPGYATIIAGPFDLDLGRVTIQNLALKRSADLEETIKVEARGEVVDTSSTKTTTTYSAEFIAGLPLLGRKFNDILTLAPGVTDTDGDGNPNVRGSRDTGLQLRLDGTNVSDPLTGHFGQDVNLETIEEIEVITAGAPAEYGRADGGFANIITKSGGNTMQGSVKVFFRSKFLDGNGSGNNDGNRGESQPEVKPYHDTRSFLTLGGAFVRDRFWYFTSVELLDRAEPIIFLDGTSTLSTQEGWRAFGKLTVQSDPDNKLTFQINYDPLEVGGNFVGSKTSPDSDFLLRTGGPTAQVKWTSVISPTLLIEALVSRLDGGQATAPVSDAPRISSVEKQIDGGQTVVKFPCLTTNCSGDTGFFKYLRPVAFSFLGPVALDSSATGPYFFEDDDSRERTTLKTDLSYTLEDHVGSHSIKTGFEFNDERYADHPARYPIVTDTTVPARFVRFPVALPEFVRFGTLSLEIYDPLKLELSAAGLNAGAYVQDSWKPVPNLTVNLGLRYDDEGIDTHGFHPFEPADEAREMLRRFDALCDAIGTACTTQRDPGRRNRGLNTLVPLALVGPNHPARALDLDGDGFVDLSSSSKEYTNYSSPLTTYDERFTEGFSVSNSNLSPRLSLSWDPWADGKTKLFGTWNRYYDRLFLGILTAEQQAQKFVAEWPVGASWGFNAGGNVVVTDIFQAEPGSASTPLSGIVSVNQVDHDLRTPYTDEWSLGMERELAPEWAVTLTYVSRRGVDLLQDKDVNHIFCPQFGEVFSVDPQRVCGDGGVLELDRFSTPAPDLFVLNENWNQILRTGNFNQSRYTSADLMLRKRLHRNWQMQFGYTYSEAEGDAEKLNDPTGNDPAVSDLVSGYLDFDQRHVLKWQGLIHLPNEVILAGTVQWASGLPFSVVSRVVDDADDRGNLTASRIFFPTGRKNDQRNDGQWTFNARLEKQLVIGKTHISGFLSGENLMDSDAAQLRTNDSASAISGGNTRRFGRRWELGVAVEF